MTKITSHKSAQAQGYAGGISITSPVNLMPNQIGAVLKAFEKTHAGIKVNRKSIIVYYPRGERENYCEIIRKNMDCKN